VRRIAILLAQRFNFTQIKPPTPTTLNLFSSYDGNIVGGLLLGAGMTLTGACPGTVLPQIATGIPSGLVVLLSGALGGVLYSRLKPYLDGKVRDKRALEKPSAYERYNVRKGQAVLVYEGLCVAILGGVSWFTRGMEEREVLLSPVVGGVLIGASQLSSLVLTGDSLGFSTAFEQIGDLFWWVLGRISPFKSTEGPKITPKPRPSLTYTIIAAGVFLGSWAVSRLGVIPTSAPGTEVVIEAWRAVLGGVALSFGARIANGCTSGHGISGMSMLSIPSILTVAAMFSGAIGLGAFI
jgi:uncharacterized membrane protein YedE/YeeE